MYEHPTETGYTATFFAGFLPRPLPLITTFMQQDRQMSRFGFDCPELLVTFSVGGVRGVYEDRELLEEMARYIVSRTSLERFEIAPIASNNREQEYLPKRYQEDQIKDIRGATWHGKESLYKYQMRSETRCKLLLVPPAWLDGFNMPLEEPVPLP